MSIRFAAGAVTLLALVGVIHAQQHQHHGMAHKIQGKNQQIHLHTTAHGHKAHAHVNNNGKIQRMSVSHNTHTAAQLKIKKVRTTQRRHAMSQAPEGLFGQGATYENHYVSTAAQGTVWVGWAFFNPTANHWVFFWFPITLVEGGIQGTENIDGGI